MKCPKCGSEYLMSCNSKFNGPYMKFCRDCKTEFAYTPNTITDALTEHGKYNDPVKAPSHYNWHPSGVECKTIAEEFTYNLGAAIKYIWRAGRKNDAIEDLQKAVEYLQNEIKRLERKGKK